jgi:glutamyl-Q tRNA(Asp) synthetase
MGSLAAALAGWLDSRTHQGNWLIRIENIDPPRERPGAAELQILQLERYGMISDEPIVLQSERHAAYEAAMQKLRHGGKTYFCRCTRAMHAAGVAAPGGAVPYAGICRDRGLGPPGAIRFRVDAGEVRFVDRACGPFVQDVSREVGDFVIRRSDGLWAYQLAVVVDDAAQGITDVVRGADLLDNTPRQILLQRALQLPAPRYLHVPVVRDAQGRKLSKQEAAQPLGSRAPLAELEEAWQHLGFAPTGAATLEAFHAAAIEQWGLRHGPAARQAARGVPAAALPEHDS